MTTKAADPFDHIGLFLEQKISLMTQYLSITRTLKETFQLNKEIYLADLLSKRQECIDRIQKADLSIQKIIGSGAGERSRFSENLKNTLNGYLQKIKSLVGRIAPLDAEVMAMVEGESRAIKAELLKMREGRQAAKGYGPQEKYFPRYIDARR
jgi:hypothetical protein